MDTQDLNNLMDGFSGGSDGRTRHWAVRYFIYSEGVKAVADKAGYLCPRDLGKDLGR